jgi:hypothetical protein
MYYFYVLLRLVGSTFSLGVSVLISTKVKRVKSTTECKRKVLLNASVKNIVLFITLIHEKKVLLNASVKYY